jgi:hypothetical protein
VAHKGKGKGKVHPRTGHEGPNGEQRYSSTLSLNSALDGEVGGQRHAPAALPPRKRPGTYCIGGWVSPRVGLGRVRKISPPPGFDPRPVRNHQVIIPVIIKIYLEAPRRTRLSKVTVRIYCRFRPLRLILSALRTDATRFESDGFQKNGTS